MGDSFLSWQQHLHDEIARLTAERDALAEQVQAALALGTIAAAERDALMAGSFDAFRILGFHVDDGDGRWWVPAAEVPETMRQLAAEQRAEYAEVDEANAEMSLALSEARAEAARIHRLTEGDPTSVYYEVARLRGALAEVNISAGMAPDYIEAICAEALAPPPVEPTEDGDR